MAEQKTRAREARKALGDLGWAGVEFGKDIPSTEFVGYDHDSIDDAKLVALVVEGEQAVFRAFAVVAVAEDTHADAPHQLVDRLHIGNGEVGGHAESAVLPVLKLMGRQHRETGTGEQQLLPPLFDGGFREPDHPLRFRQLEFQRFGLVRSEREKAFLIQHAPAVVVAGGDGKFDAALRLAAGIGDVHGKFRHAGVP